MADTALDELLSALDRLQGRGDAGGVDDPAVDEYAAHLAATRRTVLEQPPCPTAVLRRAQGLFRERSRSVTSALLSLVYDSWRDVAPAMRGTAAPRTLRFEGEAGALDLELVRTAAGTPRLLLAVEPGGPGLLAVVRDTATGRELQVDLGPDGAAEIPLPIPTKSIAVVVRKADRDVLRTPPLDLESA